MSLLNAFRERRTGIDPTLDTAALAGKRNHETLYGTYARSAWHWRMACFVVLAIVIWDRVELAFVVNDRRYIPVVVAEHEDGSMRFVGTPDPTWKPTDRTIIAELRVLLQTIRGRTTDAKFDRKQWQYAVDHSTVKGQEYLGQAYAAQEQLDAKGRIEVEPISLNKGSDGTFDLRWVERRHDINGALLKTLRFRGLFTVIVDSPTAVAALAKNVSGVWFDGWDISEEK